ncbi:18215_t:CDS:2, partial [Rhizophagus irregularis]
TNVIATKGLDFIYGKKYGNLQFTPSSSPKVKKRQEARFNALVRHTFHNTKLDDNALTDDKLQAARRHKLLFQENQRFTTPIKHLRYKKKFVEPSKGCYTFPIPFPESTTVSVPVTVETICNVSSVASTSHGNPISPANINNWENVPEHYIPLIPQSAIYEGGRLNQPSRMKVWKKKLQPLAVGSDGWLAHMKEIYDHHESMTEYQQGKIDAGIQWETTPDQGEYRRDLCDLIMQRHSQQLKEYEQKKQEDTEILEDLRSRVINEDDIFYIEYYRNECSLAYQPCAIMDDRPLK